MGNINGPMNLHISGVFEKAFSPILLKIQQLFKSGLLFFCIKICACSTVVKGEDIKYEDSRSHLYIKQTPVHVITDIPHCKFVPQQQWKAPGRIMTSTWGALRIWRCGPLVLKDLTVRKKTWCSSSSFLLKIATTVKNHPTLDCRQRLQFSVY